MISEWYLSEETQALLAKYGMEKATLDVLGIKNIERLAVELDDPFSTKGKSLVGYIELCETLKTDTKVSKKDLKDIEMCSSGVIAFREGENKKAFYSRIENYIEIKNPFRKTRHNREFKNINFYLCSAEEKIFLLPKNDTKAPLGSLMNWINEKETRKWFKKDGYEWMWVEDIGINNTNVLCNVLNQFYEDNQTPFEIIAMFYNIGELPYYRPFRQADMKDFLAIEGKIYLESEIILPTDLEEIINDFTKTFTNLKFYFKTWKLSYSNEWARCVYIVDSNVKPKAEVEKHV
jgi:hypothetical protein